MRRINFSSHLSKVKNSLHLQKIPYLQKLFKNIAPTLLLLLNIQIKQPRYLITIMANLKYKIPNKDEYPEVIEAIYHIFLQGLFWVMLYLLWYLILL